MDSGLAHSTNGIADFGQPPGVMVAADNVCRTFGTGRTAVHALRGVSFTVGRGQLVALRGRSGSGKTTLLNLIGGLDDPTAGRVWVDGREVNRMSERERLALRRDRVAFIFQSFGLVPMLSAAANVELPLLLTGLSRSDRRRRVEVALEIVGLKDRAAHKPGEMSGGQQQRVGIARAIVADPTILLCDEPTGDLDRATADEILGLLQQLNRQHGKTIVMVTHDPKAADHASRLLEMDKGTLIERAGATA